MLYNKQNLNLKVYEHKYGAINEKQKEEEKVEKVKKEKIEVENAGEKQEVKKVQNKIQMRKIDASQQDEAKNTDFKNKLAQMMAKGPQQRPKQTPITKLQVNPNNQSLQKPTMKKRSRRKTTKYNFE